MPPAAIQRQSRTWPIGAGHRVTRPRLPFDPRTTTPTMTTLELDDHDKAALADVLRATIAADKFPLSPQVQQLRAILERLEPPPARPQPFPAQGALASPATCCGRSAVGANGLGNLSAVKRLAIVGGIVTGSALAERHAELPPQRHEKSAAQCSPTSSAPSSIQTTQSKVRRSSLRTRGARYGRPRGNWPRTIDR